MAKAELIEQVLRATWSLEEAAHLVNAGNQATDPVELERFHLTRNHFRDSLES